MKLISRDWNLRECIKDRGQDIAKSIFFFFCFFFFADSIFYKKVSSVSLNII